MRHQKKRGMKLGTDASHTKAMKKSLVAALLANDRIKTTLPRAKAIRGNVDRVITWAKKGDLHSRRLAIAAVGDKEIVREVFEKAEQGMWADRNGGYTRIMKLGPRKGDDAPMVIMELVTEPVRKKGKADAKATPKKATPKKAESKSEELAEDLGFQEDGTVEQLEAVDAAAEGKDGVAAAEKATAEAEAAKAEEKADEKAAKEAEEAKEKAEEAEAEAAKDAEPGAPVTEKTVEKD